MSVGLLPIGNDAPFVDANGNPLSGGLLYTYTAGSTTAENTYTTSAGNVANANPIVLNANGYPASGGNVVEIWGTVGVSYKFELQTSAAVVVWTRDNIPVINDTSSSQNEWVAGPAPTYVSATSFTLVGDQTSTFQVGRRLKTTNTGGTIYSTIVTSAFSAVTTITVVNDSSSLDSGLSAVSYSVLASINKSVPPFNEVVKLTGEAGTNTVTATATKSATGYATGQMYVLTPAVTNTGATTLNVNSLGAKNVFAFGAACVGGELVAGVPTLIEYDGTQFNIVGVTQIIKAAKLTNSLSGNVSLSNTGNYFDGPTVAQGTVGTWFASGSVTIQDTAGAAVVQAKLWDGTTVISSGVAAIAAANGRVVIALSGYLTSPAANIKISCKDTTSTSGLIIFNASGESKDATLSVFRIG